MCGHLAAGRRDASAALEVACPGAAWAGVGPPVGVRVLRVPSPCVQYCLPGDEQVTLGAGRRPQDSPSWALIGNQSLGGISTGFPGVAQTVKNLQCRRPRFGSWVRKIPWRRDRLPSPVFWPGKCQGPRSRAGYSPWGRKESGTAERLTLFC